MKAKKQCINCSTEFEQPEGKREKKFCSDKCRATFNQKDHTKKVVLVEDEDGEWKTPDGRKVSLRWEDEENQSEEVQALMEVKDEILIPKTLDELKKMCPVELLGFEKSNWISEKRKEFNI